MNYRVGVSVILTVIMVSVHSFSIVVMRAKMLKCCMKWLKVFPGGGP